MAPVRKVSDSREAELLIVIIQRLEQIAHILTALTTTTTTV